MVYKCTQCYKDYFVSNDNNTNPVERTGVCVHCQNLSLNSNKTTPKKVKQSKTTPKKVKQPKTTPKKVKQLKTTPKKVKQSKTTTKASSTKKVQEQDPSFRLSTLLSFITLLVVIFIQYVMPNLDIDFLKNDTDYMLQSTNEFSYSTTLSLPKATVIVENNVAIGVDTRKLDVTTPQQIVLPDGVTEIADYAFADIDGLVGVTFCDSLQRVGQYAFENCYNLNYVVTNPNLKIIDDYAFSQLNIISVSLPNSLLYLGVNALSRVNIASVTIPEKTMLGSNCLNFEFYYKDNIGDEVIINNLYVKAPSSSIMGKEYTIPDGVTSIENYAFYFATGVEVVTIPEGVIYIAPCAFLQCASLKEVVLPSTLIAIDTKAFADCKSLEKVNFNVGLQYIAVDSFENCNLQNVTIPLTVINRGELDF